MAVVPCPACAPNDERRQVLDRAHEYLRIFKTASLNRPESQPHRNQAEMMTSVVKEMESDYKIRLVLQQQRQKRMGRCVLCSNRRVLEVEYERDTDRRDRSTT